MVVTHRAGLPSREFCCFQGDVQPGAGSPAKVMGQFGDFAYGFAQLKRKWRQVDARGTAVSLLENRPRRLSNPIEFVSLTVPVAHAAPAA